jgi:hypothetical protein
MRTWFSPAVCVETEIPGCSYAVTSVEKAAELLLAWPEADRGPAWRAAVAACAAAIAGDMTPAEARAAFLEAARAAGRLLMPAA